MKVTLIMTTQANNTPANVETVTVETVTETAVARVMPRVTEETGVQVVKAAVKAEEKYLRDMAKAERSQIANTREAFALLGVAPVTSAEYDKVFGKPLKAKASKSALITGSSPSGVKDFCYRTKSAACWFLLDAEASKPNMGETLNDYGKRARAALETAILPDGTPFYPRNEDGTAKKPGTSLGTPKGDTEGKETSKDKADDAGLDVKAALAAACILTGEDATKRHPQADALLTVLAHHREAFMAWAKDKKAPKAPPVTEPTAHDKALNKAILDMANGSKPAANVTAN